MDIFKKMGFRTKIIISITLIIILLLTYNLYNSTKMYKQDIGWIEMKGSFALSNELNDLLRLDMANTDAKTLRFHHHRLINTISRLNGYPNLKRINTYNNLTKVINEYIDTNSSESLNKIIKLEEKLQEIHSKYNSSTDYYNYISNEQNMKEIISIIE